MKKTKSMEDYLEAILMIQEEKGVCRSVDIANHLNFSKPSVSVAVRNLEQDGSITRSRDGSILLTPKGEAIARDILERHRFLTAFFVSIGVDPEVAENDACGMEHSISDESFECFRRWYNTRS
ncbi:MAG: metal-dependent transcriptional regulator [Clostridia bacterium]|nr:metal-dependent transcriptional regulator [Clostridia bacterium]